MLRKKLIKVRPSISILIVMVIVLINLCAISRVYAIDLDTVLVISDTDTKKQIQSSKIKVTMDNDGNYGLVLRDPSGDKVAFYNGDTSSTSNIDVWDDNGKLRWNTLAFESLSIVNNVIKMSRVDTGVARYTLSLSIVNATSQGGYMKVEMKMENLKSTPQNMGTFIYWDNMIGTNDGSPFEIIENGWRNFDDAQGFQVSAFFKDTINVSNSDAIWMGTWGSDTKFWDSNARMTWTEHDAEIGQQITSSDTAAASWYDPTPVAAGGSKPISCIIGVGPKNEAPVLTNPTFTPEMEGETFKPGDEVIIGGGAENNDDIGTQMDIVSIVDDSDVYRKVLGTVTVYKGQHQDFQYTYTIPEGLSAGAHTLKVFIMDDTGVTSTLETITFYIQAGNPPQIAISSPATGVLNASALSSGKIIVNGTASDLEGNSTISDISVTFGSTTINIGSGVTYNASNGTWTVEFTPQQIGEGVNKTLAATVTDSDGQTGTTSVTSITLDTTKAVISGATDTTIEAGSAFDAKAGVTAADTVDGDVTANIQVAGVVNTAVPGEYTLTYSYTDTAGNASSVSRKITVADTTKAVISGATDTTIESGSAFDAKAGVTVADIVDGDVTANIQVAGSVNTAVPGEYTLTYSYTDGAGNASLVSRKITVTDTTKAVISGATDTTIESGSTFDAKVGVTAADTVDGDVTANIQVAGVVNTAVPGEYTLTYSYTDTAGNASSVSRKITVTDTIAPAGYSVKFDQTVINSTYAEAMSFSFKGAEIGAAYDYTITSTGGGTPVSGSGTISVADNKISAINVTALSDGTVTLSATLTDKAGNTGASTIDILEKDTGAPEIPIIATPISIDNFVNTVEQKSVLIKGTSEPNSTVNVTFIDEGNKKVTVSAFTYANGDWTLADIDVDFGTFRDGNISISAVATDEAGNNSVSDVQTIMLDTNAPQIVSLKSDANIWVNRNIVITATVDDGTGSGVSVTKYVYGNKEVAYLQTNGIAFNGNFTVEENGTYTVYAADRAGNEAIGKVDVANIDKQSPTSPVIIRLPDRDFYNADYKIVINTGSDIGSGVAQSVYRVGNESAVTNWNIYNGPITISRIGTTQIEAQTLDNAGNISSVTKESVAINRNLLVFPTLIITPDKEYSNNDYSVIINKDYFGDSVTEAAYSSVYYKISGMSDFKVYDAPFTISNEGSYVISVKVIDRSGNEMTVSRAVYLDKTAPVCQILVEDRVIAQKDGISISINDTGDNTDTIWLSPLGTATFIEGSAMTKNNGDSKTISVPTADGEYRIYVIDRAGNVSLPSEKKVLVDRTPPTIYGVENGGVYKDYRTISISDGTVQLNDKPFVSGAKVEKNGSYKIVATDEYGNATEVSFIIDNDTETVKASADNVAIIYAKGNSADRVTKNVTLPTSGDGNVIVSWKSSNTDIMADDGTLAKLPEGNVKITLTATVIKGNAVETREFVITVFSDITPPVITLKGDSNVIVAKGELYVEKGYAAIDDIDGDITDKVLIEGYFNTKAVGNYTITYRISDSSQNEASIARKLSVIEKVIANDATIVASDEENIVDKKIGDAISAAKQNDGSEIKIVVKDSVTSENPVEISISKQQVENAKTSGISLIFETDNTSIEVPMSAVNTVNMGTNSRLKLVTEQVDTTDTNNAEMVLAVKNVNESMEIFDNKVYDFKMRIIEEDDKGNQIKDEVIKNFTSESDITLRIVVGKNNGNTVLMTYYYNPETNKWEYVRSKYNSDSGEVEMLTNHLSIYSVMTLSPEQKREEITKLINAPGITIREVLNMLEDTDMNFDEYEKFAQFELDKKNDTAHGIIDGKDNRDTKQYADYNDLKGEFDSLVKTIYNQIYGDVTAPVLELIGDSTVKMLSDSTYTEKGAKAVDNVEGDITGRIVVTGEVNTSIQGEYILTYRITDLAGNTSALTRKVIVYRKSSNSTGYYPSEAKKEIGITIIKGLEDIDAKEVAVEVINKDMNYVSGVYEIIPKNSSAQTDEEIRISYDPSKVINEDHLGIFVYDEKNGTWNCLGGIVDKEKDYVTLEDSFNGKVAVMELSKSFADLEGHWAKDVVEALASRQIIDGDGQGNFNPNMGITRAEFATIITKALNLPMTGEVTGFKDINTKDWFSPYIAAARTSGVIKGISETEFEPYRIVSREEMTAMVMRAYKLVKELTITDEQIKSVDLFKDSQHIGQWAYKDVYSAKYLKLIQGRSKDLFVPESETLRGEAAMLIYRFLKAINKI